MRKHILAEAEMNVHEAKYNSPTEAPLPLHEATCNLLRHLGLTTTL
jgi:hypothetical protein